MKRGTRHVVRPRVAWSAANAPACGPCPLASRPWRAARATNWVARWLMRDCKSGWPNQNPATVDPKKLTSMPDEDLLNLECDTHLIPSFRCRSWRLHMLVFTGPAPMKEQKITHDGTVDILSGSSLQPSWSKDVGKRKRAMLFC